VVPGTFPSQADVLQLLATFSLKPPIMPCMTSFLIILPKNFTVSVSASRKTEPATAAFCAEKL
jgi:hypothetical protein